MHVHLKARIMFRGVGIGVAMVQVKVSQINTKKRKVPCKEKARERKGGDCDDDEVLYPLKFTNV